MNEVNDFVIENGVLKKYTGAESHVVIPEGVRKISTDAFYYRRDKIVSVVIPEGVATINDNAFYNCEKLESIVLPQSIREIKYGVFYGCKSLQSIQIPEQLTCISDRAFSDCTALTHVDIPDSVREIGDSAFSYCRNLVSVRLPQTLERIGNSAFWYCAALKEINIPDSCTIGDNAFSECNAMLDEDGFLILRNRVFTHRQKEKKDVLVIPDSVEHIEDGVFAGWEANKHLQMNLRCPTWGTYGQAKVYGFARSLIGQHGATVSFRDDTGNVVAKVVLATKEESEPKQNGAILSIRQKDHAFDFANYDANWANLSKAPNKILVALARIQYPYALSEEMREVYETFLSKQSLDACKLLIDEDNDQMLTILAEKGLISKTAMPKLVDYANQQGKTALTALLLTQQHTAPQKPATPKTAKPKSKEKPMWKKPKAGTHLVGRYIGTETQVVFPLEVDGVAIEGIANTAGEAPENYKNLISVEIPEGYTSIGNKAFFGCEKLESVKLPESLVSIGTQAFAGCTSLKELYIPENVRFGGNEIFADSKVDLLVVENKENADFPKGVFHQFQIQDLVVCGGNFKSKSNVFDASIDFTYNPDMPRNFPQRVWINGEYDCMDIRESGYLARRLHPLAEFDPSGIKDVAIRARVEEDLSRPVSKKMNLDMLCKPQQVEKIDFAGASFVLSGFHQFLEPQVARRIMTSGGELKDSVSEQTDFLVIPDSDLVKTTKYKKAETLRKKGRNIAVINYAELLRHMYQHNEKLYGREGAELLKNFLVVIENGTVTLNRYVGTETTLEIPEKLGEYPIVRISDWCVFNEYGRLPGGDLTELTVPQSVKIDEYAFLSCKPKVIRK